MEALEPTNDYRYLIPKLDEQEVHDQQVFFNLYNKHRKSFIEWAEEELKDHHAFGKLITGTPKEEREKRNDLSIQLQRQAVMHGEWEPFIEYNINMGIMYSRMELNFSAWFEVVNMLREFLTPRLIDDLDHDTLMVAMRGMDRFMDISMAIIGEAYLAESKATITRQKHEQEMLNKELEQFVYIASHDLQEPLNTISSFTELLEETQNGNLTEEGFEFIGYIKSSTRQMSNLITGLLEYSRLGKKSEIEETDINELLNDVLTSVKARVNSSGAKIDVGEMPVIPVYPVEMKLLFQNLISNALKFTKAEEKPQIKIEAKKIDNCWQFTVTDNGIGLDPKHNDKIFQIFKRLHSSDQYEGTGIGLARCKKIVDLHKGKIWVDSEPGKGSSFHFKIPV